MANYPKSSALNSIARKSPKLLDELRELAAQGKMNDLFDDVAGAGDFEKYVSGAAPAATAMEAVGGRRAEVSRRDFAMEAIVRRVGRPPLLVREGTYEMPVGESQAVKDEVAGFNRDLINGVIAKTARVELANVPFVPYVGTGWIVDKPSAKKAIIVTNRHVALEFANYDGRGGYTFRLTPSARDYRVNVDFNEQYQSGTPLEVAVPKILFIAGPRDPDIALLEVEGDLLEGYEPVDLAGALPRVEADIGVVGYPAYDSRSDPHDVARYFGDIFDVKRFAFGEVMLVDQANVEIVHDATTLGGNSGSVVFDLETGKAVGLHFAGSYLEGNYAVPAEEVGKAIAGLTSSIVVPRTGTEARGDGRSPVETFKGRDGYDPEFLGKRYPIDVPAAGKWANDLQDVTDADTGAFSKELKYRHFSVQMSSSRKLPLVTAVNIDGAKSKRIGRIDKWYIDGRLPDEFQTDNDAYSRNPLDRGHMVRREDPVWGSLATAKEANIDTFHYTNCAPQHSGLNQRDWVQLENYVLGNARTRGLKVSVFTGPIFKDDDELYRGLVRLPKAFWKIAVVINKSTRKPSATGYILCQGELIKRLTEAFVYGEFKTYQVPLEVIASETGLNLDHLLPLDPFARERREEGIAESAQSLFIPVSGPVDLII